MLDGEWVMGYGTWDMGYGQSYRQFRGRGPGNGFLSRNGTAFSKRTATLLWLRMATNVSLVLGDEKRH